MADFKITKDNRKAVLSALDQQTLNALEICGGKAESYAKANVAKQVGHTEYTPTGGLMNSISHVVDADEKACYVGSTLKDPAYSIYVEFGTGIYYAGGRRTSWVYKDAKGNWHKTHGQKAKPFLKPAIVDHLEEYKNIIMKALKG